MKKIALVICLTLVCSSCCSEPVVNETSKIEITITETSIPVETFNNQMIETENEPYLSEEADIEQSKVISEVTHPIEPVVEYVFSLDNDFADIESIEDNARYLVYRNLICSYTYCTQSLFDYVSGETIDGYAPIEFDLFSNYEEFVHFIKDTYTDESSETILNDFRGKGTVFIQKDNTILYDQNRTGFTTGPFFGEKFVIEITDFSDNECNFTYSPDFSEFTDDEYKTIIDNYSESEYIHDFKMIFEDGKWKLDKMILAF